MRRKILKSAVCAAAIVLLSVVTACGGSDNSVNGADSADAEDTVDTQDEADTEINEDLEANADETDMNGKAGADSGEETVDEGDYVVLADFFTDPDITGTYDEMLAGMEEDGQSISYEVSGNDFVMIFQLTDSEMVTEETADLLATAMEEKTDSFKELAAAFDAVVEEEGACTITIRYTDPDGNVLLESTYSAQQST